MPESANVIRFTVSPKKPDDSLSGRVRCKYNKLKPVHGEASSKMLKLCEGGNILDELGVLDALRGHYVDTKPEPNIMAVAVLQSLATQIAVKHDIPLTINKLEVEAPKKKKAIKMGRHRMHA